MKKGRIACVGSGVIGLGWAALLASKGYHVDISVRDERSIDRKKKEISRILKLIDKSSRSHEDNGRHLIQFHDNVAETVSSAQYVQESVSEDPKTKEKVIQEIEEECPTDATIASSSSGLLISEIQKGMKHPERSLIVHPFHPVYLIPLVEIVPSRKTATPVLSRTERFMEEIGKKPILLKKELPGHVANRLQAAVWREAINIVLSGAVSMQDIDTSFVYGPGMRWAFIGPMMLLDLAGGEGGLAHVLSHIGPTWSIWWRSMAKWSVIPPQARKKLISEFSYSKSANYQRNLAHARDQMIADLLRLRGSSKYFKWHSRTSARLALPALKK